MTKYRITINNEIIEFATLADAQAYLTANSLSATITTVVDNTVVVTAAPPAPPAALYFTTPPSV